MESIKKQVKDAGETLHSLYSSGQIKSRITLVWWQDRDGFVCSFVDPDGKLAAQFKQDGMTQTEDGVWIEPSST